MPLSSTVGKRNMRYIPDKYRIIVSCGVDAHMSCVQSIKTFCFDLKHHFHRIL